MEMLIVIAIIAVLIAVAIPVFASQLEKAREATDLANVRSAYAKVSTEALLGDSETTVTVDLKQKQADWQSLDPVNIGGIVHYKTQGDTVNWIGVAAPNGTCVVSYKEDYGIILTWSGKADPSISKEILKKERSFLRWKQLTMPTSKHWVIPNTIPYASPSLKILYSVTTSKSAFSATSSNTKRDSLK